MGPVCRRRDEPAASDVGLEPTLVRSCTSGCCVSHSRADLLPSFRLGSAIAAGAPTLLISYRRQRWALGHSRVQIPGCTGPFAGEEPSVLFFCTKLPMPARWARFSTCACEAVRPRVEVYAHFMMGLPPFLKTLKTQLFQVSVIIIAYVFKFVKYRFQNVSGVRINTPFLATLGTETSN